MVGSAGGSTIRVVVGDVSSRVVVVLVVVDVVVVSGHSHVHTRTGSSVLVVVTAGAVDTGGAVVRNAPVVPFAPGTRVTAVTCSADVDVVPTLPTVVTTGNAVVWNGLGNPLGVVVASSSPQLAFATAFANVVAVQFSRHNPTCREALPEAGVVHAQGQGTYTPHASDEGVSWM